MNKQPPATPRPLCHEGSLRHEGPLRSMHPSPLTRELNIESLRLTPLDTSRDTAHASDPSSSASSPSLSRSVSASSRRRRFSHHSNGGSACTSPMSSPLFGSYKHSLLSGRMAAPASPPSPFTLTLSINSLPPFRNFFVPPKLHLPFEAAFYEMSGPWVGAIDLDEAPELQTKMYQAEGGYRVPPKGQVQLVIKNQLGTVMKILLVPYDLKDMPPGSQAPMRRVWYGEAAHEMQPEPPGHISHDKDNDKDKEIPLKEVIRYAVHLKFVCPPSRPPPQRPRAHSAGHAATHRGPFSKFAMTSISSANVVHDTVESDEGEISSHSAGEGPPLSRGSSLTGSRKKVVRSASMDPRKIFLAGEIRLVFASRIPDEEEMVRAENEEGRAGERYFAWEGRPNSSDDNVRD
ncbi:hypothetical protein K439DRAFT_615360 [Ramaria rubella]|nr:hypothetical protein K439DRAFT_615360 [Ramaria rubella]